MKIEDLNKVLLEDIAKMLKALSDPTRLSIMQCLHQKELCVSDIVQHLEAKQA
ncbi:MAG: ArsR family transcriptional regulator, partial [Deltaproteobacteria bacterium]|nr:ArsR family transcriptional regulator [Deltaproteobacteria bacterium]